MVRLEPYALRKSHAQAYNDLYQDALQTLQSLIEDYVVELENLGVVLDQTTMQQVQAYLRSEGLPQIERDILQELGIGGEWLDALEAAVPDLLSAEAIDNWQASPKGYVALLDEAAAADEEWIQQEIEALPTAHPLYLPVLLRD